MKRISLIAALCMCAGVSFGQIKVVKEARSIANEDKPDFKKAITLINEAMNNPETKNDPMTWDVAGLIQKKMSAKQMEKAYLKQPYDTAQVYNCAYNMCKYYMECDKLAQIPNEKGKIKNKYRKENAATILSERPNLINGGVFYYNKNDEKQALKFFGMYVDVSKSPMLETAEQVKNDTILPQIAYYATLAAMKLKDNDAILKYGKIAVEDKENGKTAMELMSNALKEKGDTIQWIESLKEGLQKFPDDKYFFGNLIDYYSSNNKSAEAMKFADDMLAKEPNNSFYLFVKGYLFQNLKEYDKAIEAYKKAIAVKADYAEAYSNIGLIYCVLAQDFSEKATSDVNSPNYKSDQEKMKKFYEEALPYYEKARELQPDNKNLWLNGLYRIYYNLNMGDKFKEIESLMQ